MERIIDQTERRLLRGGNRFLPTRSSSLNSLLGSNYMFLCRPPAGPESPFFFAGWPWYIPIIDLVALGMFFVVLSPFLVARWRASQVSASPA